jgi:hypothetical protein
LAAIQPQIAIFQQTLGPVMAKKTRKKAAAKAAKKSKGLKKKAAATKKGRKAAARKKSKPAAKKKLIAKARPARRKIRKPPPVSFPQKVEREAEDIIRGIGDIFSDAEQLHQKLDPGVSREPE